MIILTLPTLSATSISKYKTDPLRSVSLLTPRHLSAQLRVAVQRPLFYTHRMRYPIVELKYTPACEDCQYPIKQYSMFFIPSSGLKFRS